MIIEVKGMLYGIKLFEMLTIANESVTDRRLDVQVRLVPACGNGLSQSDTQHDSITADRRYTRHNDN